MARVFEADFGKRVHILSTRGFDILLVGPAVF
jgi:hypothetical protein